MSSTRSNPLADPGDAPERHLSALHLRGINVSLSIVAQAARTYDRETREAALWLANLSANSQRIQLCWQRRLLPDPLGTVGKITEADLSARLGLDRLVIYSALTGGASRDELADFRTAVQRLRAELEKAVPPLVKTADTETIQSAFSAAAHEHDIAVLEGKWRHGKTEWCERQWLTNLHRAIWVHVPSNAPEKSFLNAIASALGIGTGNGKKPAQLREQIKTALGVGLIDTLILDEAHNLWPTDIGDAKPVRAEFVRELRDCLGVGALLIVTDQFALSLEMAKQSNKRWAPGQFLGRRRPFKLRDSHSDKEIASIARLHAGQIAEDALAGLVAFAKADEGYLGAMVNAVKSARSAANARRGEGAPIEAAEVADATRALQTETRIVELARVAAPRRRVSNRRAA